MATYIYETDKAIVKIHDGKLTEEERRVVIENAAKKFFRELQKQSSQKG